MLGASAPRASTVAVTRLPDDLTRRAQTLGANAWQPELRTLAPLRDDPQSRTLMRDVAEFLRTWTAYGARPQDVFLSGGRGGQATTCWSGGESAWVGLHVDDWRNKPPSERAFSPNRLMLNAGTQPRHLVFMDRTVAAMALELNRFRARLGQAPISLRSGSPHDIGLEFMETFPEYPLLRLRLDPGEAYIAPTDNLVHDGSTFDMRGDRPADLVLCALGYIEPARIAPRDTSLTAGAV